MIYERIKFKGLLDSVVFEREMSPQVHVSEHLIPDGGNALEDCETSGGRASLEKVGHCGQALRLYSSVLLPVCSVSLGECMSLGVFLCVSVGANMLWYGGQRTNLGISSVF